ncbi:MAG: exonuclease SbcCD subunit D [Bacteroidales bacterium]|nr:exonuclease SbcCD subunit D [Bacteroidales bacterium]
MTKILHTSDWHLGHVLFNYDRTEEQQHMLQQIEQIVREQQPATLLPCGDVHHTSQPTAPTQKMFTEAIVRMHMACPSMVMVITSGNHDSGSRHEIFSTPWKALNVYTIGTLSKEEEALDDHIVEVPGKAFVVAVPYAYERMIPDGFYQSLLDRVAARNPDGLPVVMTAHTTVRGADVTGHENATEYTVGGVDYCEISEMGTGYDYLALGHIHHAQYVHGGDKRVRYCGTPIPVSFNEEFDHSVSMVQIDRHGDAPLLETIPIENKRPLVTLPPKGYASWEEAKQMLADFDDNKPAYIRLNVEVEDFLPVGANAEAQQLTEHKQCRFCLINARRKESQAQANKHALTVSEFKQERPLDMIKRYAEDVAFDFDEIMESLFGEVEQLLQQELNENKN